MPSWESRSQVLRILPRRGRIGLELAVPGLLGAAAGGVALDQEELRAVRFLAGGAVGELAGQGGALVLTLLALDHLRLALRRRRLGVAPRHSPARASAVGGVLVRATG
jgi:hypothetical protein